MTVRRFMLNACGEAFHFDRAFMAWINNGEPKTMEDVTDEWMRRHAPA